MSVYLYRAVATEHVDDAYMGEPIAWPGMSLGRASGYLSRSGAKSAGERSGIAFEIVRSEPVVFLTRGQQLQKRINEMHAELDAIMGRS